MLAGGVALLYSQLRCIAERVCPAEDEAKRESGECERGGYAYREKVLAKGGVEYRPGRCCRADAGCVLGAGSELVEKRIDLLSLSAYFPRKAKQPSHFVRFS